MKKVLTSEEIKKLLEENEEAQKLALSYEEYFREHFFLTPSEIRKKIEDIFSRNNLEVAEKISEVVQQFAFMEISDETSGKKKMTPEEEYNRKRYANTTLNKILELYLKNDEEIKQDVFDVLGLVKEEFSVNVMSLAYKGTFRSLSKEKYMKMLSSLRVIEEEGFALEKEEVKKMIENCSSILYRTDEKKTKEVVEYLSAFAKDENGNFVLNVKEILKGAPTILTETAESLNDTVCFLEERFSRQEIVEYVRKYPSILTIDRKKVEGLENVLAEAIKQVCTANGIETNGTEHERARKFCTKMERLSTISHITADQLSIISCVPSVLIKYGIDSESAVDKLLDLSFITKFDKDKFTADDFDGLLAKLTIEEQKTGVNWTQIFFDNPNAIFKNKVAGIVRPSKSNTEEDVTIAEETEIKEKKLRKPVQKKVKMTEDEAEKVLIGKADSTKKKVDEMFNQLKGKNQEAQAEEENYIQKLKLSSALKKLDEKTYEHPFLEIVERIETAFDTKFESGYAEKEFNLSEMKKIFNTHIKNMRKIDSQEIVDAVEAIKAAFEYGRKCIFKSENHPKNKQIERKGMKKFLTVAQILADKIKNIRSDELRNSSDKSPKFKSLKMAENISSFWACTYYVSDCMATEFVIYPIIKMRESFSEEEQELILPKSLLRDFRHQKFTTEKLMVATESLYQLVDKEKNGVMMSIIKDLQRSLNIGKSLDTKIFEIMAQKFQAEDKQQEFDNSPRNNSDDIDSDVLRDLEILNNICDEICEKISPKAIKYRERFNATICYDKDGIYYVRPSAKEGLFMPKDIVDEDLMKKLGIKKVDEVVADKTALNLHTMTIFECAKDTHEGEGRDIACAVLNPDTKNMAD